MRNINKLFSPNGQLRIDDDNVYEGDFHTITISEDAKFVSLLNGEVDILLRDNLQEKVIKSTDQPLTGHFTLIRLEFGVVYANRN
ncbi:MAG: hypothetical protein KQI35_01150 [Bacteroidetes bacterium]|nr:hypothetical protein [Bacteroidota bacterium]